MEISKKYGGEGGIRTPDTLTGMSDFESGAFNRALPPLRIVTTYSSATCNVQAFRCFCRRISGVRFGVPLISRLHQSIDSRGLVFRSEMGIPMTICRVLCPGNSATVRKSTLAITSLPAKVGRLQCLEHPSIPAPGEAPSSHHPPAPAPARPGEAETYCREAKRPPSPVGDSPNLAIASARLAQARNEGSGRQ